MSSTILIFNGPNLNMLGMREPEIYGTESLEDIRRLCEECASSLYMKLDFRQTNSEGELIGWIHESRNIAGGLILNPAGLGHTSVALMDALLSVPMPAIEVHITNPHKREEFRHTAYTSKAVRGVISGMGSFGYVLAMYALNDIFKKDAAKKPA